MNKLCTGREASQNLTKTLPVFIIFGLLFSLISIVNHSFFRTYALDLGTFNQALYSISHFRKAVFTLGLEGYEIRFWGTHFSPIVFLYVPFHLLFGSYGLLIVQILAILFGGLGIFKYSFEILKDFSFSLIIMLIFFGLWGIYSALSFDFHNNVIGAMMVPWFFYCLVKENLKGSALFFLLIISAQESTALWMIFIIGGLLVREISKTEHLKNKKTLRLLLVLLPVSVIYFLSVTLVIIPHFNQQTSFFFRYEELGRTFPGIVASIASEPVHALRIFFGGSSGPGITHHIKLEFHLMVLFGGGLLLLYRPYYIIMLAPVYLQKMLSSDPVLWGINMQYSIEFVPILALCMADSAGIAPIRRKYAYAALLLILFSAYASNAVTMIKRNSIWYNKTNTVFWQKSHYKSDLDIKEIREAIGMIPDGIAVSVSSPLAPHLYKRDKLYHFPVVKDAVFVMILKGKEGIYPMNADRLAKAIDDLKNSGNFKIIKESAQMILLKRE